VTAVVNWPVLRLVAGCGRSIGAAMGLAYQQLNSIERAVWDAIGSGTLVDSPAGEPVRA
jgi:hypothetical protein